MPAALGLLLVALASQDPAGDLAPTLRAQARVEAGVSTVEAGEPFELALVVRHAATDAPTIEPAGLEADPTWALLDGGERTTLPDPDREGFVVTRVRWRLASLEPGARELPVPELSFAAAAGTAEPFAIERSSLEVRGVLVPGEDQPRPLGDFRGLGPEPPSGWGRLAALGIAFVAALAALFAWWMVRRRKAVPVTGAASPLERLVLLEQSDLEQPDRLRAAHVELTRALREQVDHVLGPTPPGWTDQEWARRLSERLGAERAEPYVELLGACESVKYGADRPTHWAALERVARARELAEAVAQHSSPVELAP